MGHFEPTELSPPFEVARWEGRNRLELETTERREEKPLTNRQNTHANKCAKMKYYTP